MLRAWCGGHQQRVLYIFGGGGGVLMDACWWSAERVMGEGAKQVHGATRTAVAL